MTIKTLEKPSNFVPFTLCFLEEVPQEMYNQAIAESELLKSSYNPETQTSNIPLYAGTSLTYGYGYSDPLRRIKDDVTIKDT
jgi:hypothetical protein